MSVFSQIRKEDLQWAQLKFDRDVVEDPEPYRSLVLERQRLAARSVFLAEELRTGGRKRKQHTNHAKKHRGIVEDYLGTPAVLDGNGVILERRIPAKHPLCDFFTRYLMSPDLFQRIYDDIKDPRYGCTAFVGHKDAYGRAGASALQKMVSVMRQLAYGTAADSFNEYSGVKKNTARLAFMLFASSSTVRLGRSTWGPGEKMN